MRRATDRRGYFEHDRPVGSDAGHGALADRKRHRTGRARGIAAGEDALDAGFLGEVGLDEITKRTLLEFATERLGDRAADFRAGDGEEPGERDGAAILENDVDTIAGQLADPGSLDSDAPRLQLGEILCGGFEGAVEEECHLPPIGQHQRVMHRHFRTRQHADRALIELISMAIGAVEDMLAPPLCKSGNIGERIADAGGEDAAPAFMRAALRIGDGVAGGPPVDLLGAPVEPGHGRVFHQLRATIGGDLAGIAAILAEEAVGVGGKSVAAPAFVDDEHLAPRPRELERRRKAGIAAADNDHVIHSQDPSGLCPTASRTNTELVGEFRQRHIGQPRNEERFRVPEGRAERMVDRLFDQAFGMFEIEADRQQLRRAQRVIDILQRDLVEIAGNFPTAAMAFF